MTDSFPRCHAVIFFVHQSLFIISYITDRFKYSCKHRSYHHMICSCSQCENHISRRLHSSISSDKSSEFFSFLSTFVDGRKLWSTDSCFHSCRTHRSWTYSYFHTICSSFNQRFRCFSSDNISCNHGSFVTKLLSKLFDHINHGLLISMCCVQNKCSNSQII